MSERTERTNSLVSVCSKGDTSIGNYADFAKSLVVTQNWMLASVLDYKLGFLSNNPLAK